MERVLLFDRQMNFDYIPVGQEESETRKPAFGFILTNIPYTHYELAGYVAYLAAAQKWDDLGGDVELNIWTMAGGARYDTFDSEIQEFIEQAISENPISCEVYEINLDLTGGIVNEFVADANLAQRIKAEGKLVDVLQIPICENDQGV